MLAFPTVSSFVRDSTGTKDLNEISELSHCYLKNEESATEREAATTSSEPNPFEVTVAAFDAEDTTVGTARDSFLAPR
ncbi:hypothetical protein L1987_60289 [Smallanthus sonchifolius]|uniref:Uncharacterized protein n=1 Tax=Smallanthus sonchifolius TaxID=185202 RepID=A0ACB9D8G3_9ASTR|nr:hypothetical protein L1987_60289 [Smallanthus sonchifolius]